MSESEYEKKRDFRKTPEPSGKEKDGGPGKSGSKNPFFVIQKHDASSLHYDFRLLIDDTLKSWAVPKGPSTDPREKRLAIRTEDHPVDYGDFEGTIPEDEYGGGTVMIWDTGPFENITEKEEGLKDLSRALKDGHLLVWLKGEKIKGGYALHRIEDGENEQWLLTKMKDDKADARRNPTSTEPKSVKTGRTLRQIEQDAKKDRSDE